MFKKIEDVRYTNSAHDILYVLFIDDDDNKQEMYIESSGPERDEIAVSYTHLTLPTNRDV